MNTRQVTVGRCRFLTEQLGLAGLVGEKCFQLLSRDSARVGYSELWQMRLHFRLVTNGKHLRSTQPSVLLCANAVAPGTLLDVSARFFLKLHRSLVKVNGQSFLEPGHLSTQPRQMLTEGCGLVDGDRCRSRKDVRVNPFWSHKATL